MRKIVVLGAGHSSPFLIRWLLERSASLDAEVVVADLSQEQAAARIDGHPRGRAIALDISDDAACVRALTGANVLVHLLPPHLQGLAARRAIEQGAHFVSASYRAPETAELDGEAQHRGLTLLTEMGLDPGIDLMSAQQLIDGFARDGFLVERFASYGAGLPEPSFDGNPLRYCITWNPRNVVMAAAAGARFLEAGKVRLQPRERVFEASWPVEVPGVGRFDAYANRDSIGYREIHGLDEVSTLVRGTLRWPGFCDVWLQIVRLGLPIETVEVPDLASRTWAELTEMFVGGPQDDPAAPLRTRVARRLDLDAGDRRLDVLENLGFFADTPILEEANDRLRSPADALVHLLEQRLILPAGVRDMVLLHHEFDLRRTAGQSVERRRVVSTLEAYGEPGGITAMARTVGLPAALGVHLLLDGSLDRRGCIGPTASDIYQPVLAALEAEGLRFSEHSVPVAEGPAEG
ncbi:MAG: saccharopine dehydrogenase C-terminal domain-containing protein [Acidobacteriota bacterium]